ncbi:ASCH domain-containing protein [Rhizobium phage RHph_TM3_3_3]|nr:ASCH domain-containing protein [Rhizobium phage RHph_TM3_3_3]
MTDRPILFSGPMIRALLAGTKTQTRRLASDVPSQPGADCHPRNKPKHPAPYLDSYCSERKTAANPRGMSVNWCWWQVDDRQCLPTFKVKAQPGDRLWVRETWQGLSFGDYRPTKSSQCEVRYAATDPCADLDAEARGYPWRPSIFMPRWASRLTLTVTDVRVERLQDISEADAIAEGIERSDRFPDRFMTPAGDYAVPVVAYQRLWDSINGKGAWADNPWIVAYTFTVHRQNIDAMSKEAA